MNDYFQPINDLYYLLLRIDRLERIIIWFVREFVDNGTNEDRKYEEETTPSSCLDSTSTIHSDFLLRRYGCLLHTLSTRALYTCNVYHRLNETF